jgi:hypothetical protein
MGDRAAFSTMANAALQLAVNNGNCVLRRQFVGTDLYLFATIGNMPYRVARSIAGHRAAFQGLDPGFLAGDQIADVVVRIELTLRPEFVAELIGVE